jgi:hypothetical protein
MQAGRLRVAIGAALTWLAAVSLVAAAPVDLARLREAARTGDWQAVQAMGPAALPELARVYSESPSGERAAIADIFYKLGWKSEDAKRALLADVRTPDPALRLSVQWALGRVSDAPKLQVRQVAIQALSILTHQTKGYAPAGDAAVRSAAVAAWRRWLVEYRANL